MKSPAQFPWVSLMRYLVSDMHWIMPGVLVCIPVAPEMSVRTLSPVVRAAASYVCGR